MVYESFIQMWRGVLACCWYFVQGGRLCATGNCYHDVHLIAMYLEPNFLKKSIYIHKDLHNGYLYKLSLPCRPVVDINFENPNKRRTREIDASNKRPRKVPTSDAIVAFKENATLPILVYTGW